MSDERPDSPEDAPSRTSPIDDFPFLALAWCAVILILGSSAVGAGEPATKPEFADSWFLVRLTATLEAQADGSFSSRTGLPAVDALIVETGVHRIERALTVSTRSPRFPSAIQRLGLDRTYKFFVPDGTDLTGVVTRFGALAEVEYAEPDFVGAGGARFPNDPRLIDQWGFNQSSDADVDGPEAWDIRVGEDVVVAVLDSGADTDHQDLVGKLLPGFDFANNDADPEDDHGHGTNVASVASANTDNGVGVAGSCWNCSIMPLKVLNEQNWGFYSWWADAMVYATDHGARVINLSAGGYDPSQTLLDGVRYAYDAGVIHITITQNDDVPTISYPGRYSETVAVGGTDEFDLRADPFCYSATSGSNYGPEIDVIAPGDWILGTGMGGGYGYWCGTSQAAPLVAGLVGIMETLYPSVGREEARHLLRAGAEDQVGRPTEDTAGFDVYHGWGRVNMHTTLLATRASIALRLEGKQSTRVFLDAANPVADSYDFIRGDLSELTESASGVDVGSVVCIEDDSPDPDTAGNEDSDPLLPGQGFFYLARFNAAPGAGSYGGSSTNRDRTPSTGDCGS